MDVFASTFLVQGDLVPRSAGTAIPVTVISDLLQILLLNLGLRPNMFNRVYV